MLRGQRLGRSVQSVERGGCCARTRQARGARLQIELSRSMRQRRDDFSRTRSLFLWSRRSRGRPGNCGWTCHWPTGQTSPSYCGSRVAAAVSPARRCIVPRRPDIAARCRYHQPWRGGTRLKSHCRESRQRRKSSPRGARGSPPRLIADDSIHLYTPILLVSFDSGFGLRPKVTIHRARISRRS